MWKGRPLKAGGLHRLIKSHVNYWHFPKLRLKRTWGSLLSDVLLGVLVARRQGGLGLIACLLLFFSTGCLICPKNILRVQLLQSLGKMHLGSKTIFSNKEILLSLVNLNMKSLLPWVVLLPFMTSSNHTDIQELESTTSACMPFLLKADCYFNNVHTNHPNQPCIMAKFFSSGKQCHWPWGPWRLN